MKAWFRGLYMPPGQEMNQAYSTSPEARRDKIT